MRYGLWSELVRKVCARSWTPTGEMMGGFGGLISCWSYLTPITSNNCRYVMIYVGFGMVLVKSVHKTSLQSIIISVGNVRHVNSIEHVNRVCVPGNTSRFSRWCQFHWQISIIITGGNIIFIYFYYDHQHHHHHHHHHQQQQQQQQQKQQHLHDLHMVPIIIITTTLPNWRRLIDHQAPVIDLANGTYHTAGPRLSDLGVLLCNHEWVFSLEEFDGIDQWQVYFWFRPVFVPSTKLYM